MADISITAANVIAGTAARTVQGAAGATITAGQAVAYNTATKRWVLADADHATAALRIAGGIALNGAADGQPITVQTSGPITIGGTLTAGVAYYLSGTPGGICPVADVGAGENVCLLGLAASTTVLNLDIQNPGVTL
jgi:hypothetical protein